jgi:hypothetical protein
MNEPHPTALQLLERHLEIGIVNNLEAWYALFDEDAVLGLSLHLADVAMTQRGIR